jgi:cytoskeleton protein RodZ
MAAPTMSPPVAPPTRSPGEEARVVLRARADTWIQLRDPTSGAVLLNRVLRPGESYVVPAREGLLLSTGNAGGLDIEVDGEVVPGLGTGPTVRRDVPVEPERLKAGLPPPTAGRAGAQ